MFRNAALTSSPDQIHDSEKLTEVNVTKDSQTQSSEAWHKLFITVLIQKPTKRLPFRTGVSKLFLQEARLDHIRIPYGQSPNIIYTLCKILNIYNTKKSSTCSKLHKSKMFITVFWSTDFQLWLEGIYIQIGWTLLEVQHLWLEHGR